ncbi:MAG: hypothetical protein KA113_16085 [Syntrophaceae bacterium]|nr:hypothetical protein [Syntrophaceae bacterium]
MVSGIISLHRFDWGDSCANNKSKPISLSVSASADDWRNFYYYLQSGAPTLLDSSCYPQLIHEVECICIEKRIIGPNAVDKRKTKAKNSDELKKFVAVVYTFVEYWKEKTQVDWPDEYKELLKITKGKRRSLRENVYEYCLEKGKLKEDIKRKSFDYQFIDREKQYLEVVKSIADRFAKEHGGQFPSLEELSDIVVDRSVLSFP